MIKGVTTIQQSVEQNTKRKMKIDESLRDRREATKKEKRDEKRETSFESAKDQDLSIRMMKPRALLKSELKISWQRRTKRLEMS